MPLNDCKISSIPKISDLRGNLSFVEGGEHVPFDIKRIYYLYDVPGGSERGSHAHYNLHQLIIAVSGSFDVELDDGFASGVFSLNRASSGLYVCPMMWRTLKNFSSGAVCLVIASERYAEEDYIRNYVDFKEKVKSLS